ncbi:crumbs cell polarity complex component 2 [Phyllostomus discolor]|uniref:Crumbs cell polarity complex component 2 n=1 Tax=Phyllostomus discolor TaxID=89673 RepID=A0A834B3Z7_9CHIR|nr:crumbs cell polarity complex component 2 [Phyllostomus discolor]
MPVQPEVLWPVLRSGEGPAAAAAVPAAGGGGARGLRLPPAPPPGPPLRDPGGPEAPPVRGHLQPEPAGGGRGPAGDGQCPQGATRGETHLGLPGHQLQHREAMNSFCLDTRGGRFQEPAGQWPPLLGLGELLQGTGTCCRARGTCWGSVLFAGSPCLCPSVDGGKGDHSGQQKGQARGSAVQAGHTCTGCMRVRVHVRLGIGGLQTLV